MKDFGSHSQKSKYIVLTYDLILPIIVILVIIVGLIVVLKSKLLTVKVIDCQVDYQNCEVGPITAELDKYKGFNLLNLDTEPIVQKLTAGDYTIREALIKKKFPNTLVVNLQSVYPAVAMRVVGVDNEWLVLDQKYRVIGLRSNNPNVPTVLLDTPPSVHVGQQLTDPKLVQALDLGIMIGSELPTVKSIALSGSTVTLELDGGKRALMTVDKDKTEQIRTLQAILGSSTIDSGVRNIDVRFSKPVLR